MKKIETIEKQANLSKRNFKGKTLKEAITMNWSIQLVDLVDQLRRAN